MPAYPCNPGVFTYSSPHGGGTFRPKGKLAEHGMHRNPEDWDFQDTWAARLIVGFSVGQTPTYHIDDLIPIVQRVRTQQVGDPSSTFIAQKGIYQHKDPAQGIVVEDGAQIILIDTHQTERTVFRKQMVELAEIVAQELQQELVVVEIQHNGLTQVTIGVRPY